MTDRVKELENLRTRQREKYRYLDKSKIEIGDFTYGEPILRSWARDGEENARCVIGKFCSIGGNVQIILGGNHRNDWITTYPFNQLLPENYGYIKGHPATKGDVIIGNDVWIGSDVKIMSGVHIGDGATIAASAVVAKDVAPYSVVAGNPAVFKKWRYSADYIGQKVKWWDWPLEKIAEAIPFLQSDDTYGLMNLIKGWGDDNAVLQCDHTGA